MDFRQRFVDQQEQHRTAIQGAQSRLWTALPGVIVSYNPAEATAEVQPAVMAKYTDPDTGAESDTQLPVLPDVPVCFPRGGGFSLSFPVRPGDECLLVFSSRCIDAWWQNGGVQPQAEKRLHSLSDAMAVLGPFSQASMRTIAESRARNGVAAAEQGLGASTVRLSADDGSLSLEMGGGVLSLAAPTKIVLASPLVECAGEVVFGAASGGPVGALTHEHLETGARTLPPVTGS